MKKENRNQRKIGLNLYKDEWMLILNLNKKNKKQRIIE